MRKTILFLFSFFFVVQSVTATGIGQSRVNFSVNQATIIEAIEKLFAGTHYSIAVAAKDLENTKRVTVAMTNATVDQVMAKILENTNLEYRITDKEVVISKKVQKPKQQEKRIVKGRVLEKESREPVIGASVFIPGSLRGTTTDLDGNFMLDVTAVDKFTVSCISYKSIEVLVGKEDQMTIFLETDIMALGEVVVNGYTTTTISRVTGSIGIIDSEQLKDAPLKSMDMLIQGKIPGVNVQAISGRPGETAKIRIRGTNTISGNAEPLWVVDGVMLQKDIPSITTGQVKAGDFNTLFTNGIAGINPNDIENITVLKDASASAIYGSRAAGGVIVITTKRGKEGELSIQYSGNVSVVTKPIRDVSLMNSHEKIEWEKELWNTFSAEGYNKGEYYPVIGIVGMARSGYGKFGPMSAEQREDYLEDLKGNTTDWFDQLFRPSVSHNHYLSLSGGNKKTSYYISMGYGTNNGLVKNNTYDRYNLSSKIDMTISDRVKVGFNTTLSYQYSKDASGSTDLFKYAYFANPYEKPFNQDGSYRPDETYFELGKANGNTAFIIPDNGINIIRDLNETSSRVNSFDMMQVATLSWRMAGNLKFEGLASLTYSNNNTDNINGKDTYAAFSDRPFEGSNFNSQRKYGSIFQSSAYNNSYNLRGQLNYNKEFGRKHYVSILLGSEVRKSFSKNIFEKRYGYDPVSGNSSFPIYPVDESGTIPNDYLINYAKIMDGLSGQSIDESAMASFYFSTDYSYEDRYTASMTARTDGSNNFGSKQQFNPIWSLGFTWNASNEPFLKGKLGFVNDLSFRVATGYTGNINKSVYPQFIMNYNNDFRKTYEEFYRMGYVGSAPNPNLRWERTFDYKIGASAAMFKSRLRVQAEYYYRLSSDVVTPVRVPETTGFRSQSYNTSKIENQGVEFSVSGTAFSTKEFTLSASANISYNRNMLKEYISPTGGSLYDNMHVNYPLNSLFTGIPVGIDKYTGVYLFKERSDAVFEDRSDYENGDNYLFYVGTNNAPLTGGYSVSARYRKLSVSVGGVYSFGAKVLNEISSPAYAGVIQKSSPTSEKVPTSHNDLYRNHLNVLKNSSYLWTAQNPVTDGMPRLIDAYGPNAGYETYMTTSSTINKGALTENVSYFKINSVMISYSLDDKLLHKYNVKSLGLNLTVNNILTISNYSGFDPETPGVVYPQSKSFSFGVNIGF
jgi:TonB-linked SusC/RagA family outer membrane protein